MLEAFQGFSDGVEHGYVNVVFWLVPIDGQSTVIASRPLDGDRVMILEFIDEVGVVVSGEEFDSEVVYSKSEGGG